MKKIYFFILMCLFTLTLSVPVLAVSTADGHEVYSYKDRYNTQWSYCMAEVDVPCYSVYFSEEHYYWIFSNEQGSVYHNGFTTGSLPRDFGSNQCYKLNDAGAVQGYTADFKIYYACATPIDPTIMVYENFDYTYATRQEFFDKLAEYDSFEKFDDDNNPFKDNGDRLPLLTFKIKQAWTVADIGASVKYTFSWNVAEHDIYANNPNLYKVQMLASAKYTENTTLGTTTVNAEDITFINNDCKTYVDSAIPIYQESYSFLERSYRNKLCDIAGVNKNYSSETSSYYFLFVRIVDPESGKSSLWKVYKCQGRNISSTGYYYDDEGNGYAGDSNDEIDNGASYDNDPSTDDVNSPTSPNYNDGAELDAQHLINNLKEIVETLKGLPELFQKVFLWMPNYLIVLIITSIGLLIVVGFVKMFLH